MFVPVAVPPGSGDGEREKGAQPGTDTNSQALGAATGRALPLSMESGMDFPSFSPFPHPCRGEACRRQSPFLWI